MSFPPSRGRQVLVLCFDIFVFSFTIEYCFLNVIVHEFTRRGN
jgi:hypothetical protein